MSDKMSIPTIINLLTEIQNTLQPHSEWSEVVVEIGEIIRALQEIDNSSKTIVLKSSGKALDILKLYQVNELIKTFFNLND